MATESAPYLGRLIADVVKKTGAENVWVMGSSLGCQTIAGTQGREYWILLLPQVYPDRLKIDNAIALHKHSFCLDPARRNLGWAQTVLLRKRSRETL